MTTDERKVVDSIPFQRLRNIHQLAMSYLVYPGATHKRFEHSLGLMELASRVYDIVTEQDIIHAKVRDLIPEISQKGKLDYWRNALRMAALCHDLGHLPFSHAAEKLLLPDGWDHERLTVELYEKNPEELSQNPHISKVVFNEAETAFGSENIRRDSYSQGANTSDFPVLRSNGRISSSYVLSETLQHLPLASFDYVFIRPDLLKEGLVWLEKNLGRMLGMVEKEEQ